MAIEIIGIGLRFPGLYHPKENNDKKSLKSLDIERYDLTTVNDFWHFLKNGQSAMSPLPSDRWDHAPFLNKKGGVGKTITFNAGWLDKIDRFDYSFFNLSKREAAEMDPQQRLVLEVACEALHDAGINPHSLSSQTGSRTGVFVGAGMAEYQSMSFGAISDITRHTMSGNSLAVIANRLSYYFDLDGPSLTVDTACSAAMTAFSLACQAIESGQCDQAIVSGINTMLGPSPFVGFTQANMLSPRGICSPFDEKADGFARGEGCGVIILKRRDENHTSENRPVRKYAEVLGYGTNEDGRTASLTMPSEKRQKSLYNQTLENAGLKNNQIVYVEAHGTGTPVGDPIEARSIATSLSSPERKAPLAIGSVKGNIGHLETAAGIAGLIKAALCLYNKELVPTANHEKISSKIDSTALNIRVPKTVEPLPSLENALQPAIGICSYGFGGANGFAVLGLANNNITDTSTLSQNPENAVAIPLSAHKAEALKTLEADFDAIESSKQNQAGRWAGAILPQKQFRKVKILPSTASTGKALEFEGRASGNPPRLMFAFSGQGSQMTTMGTRLYQRFPHFRQTIDRATHLYEQFSGRSLIRDHGFCTLEGLSKGDQENVEIAMPCVVMLQVGLVELLKIAGVKPDCVIGHSTGEMTAAWQRGALTLENLCQLVAERAKAQAKMPAGAMAALGCNAQTANEIIQSLGLNGKACVAAANSTQQVTISGNSDAIETLLKEAQKQKISAIKLAVKRAFHSHHVQPVLSGFRQGLVGLLPQKAHTPMFSSVAGMVGMIEGEAMTADYWVQNVQNPVDFLGASSQAANACNIAVEIAPRKTLKNYLIENLSTQNKRGTCISALETKGPEDQAILACCAQLYTQGINVNWSALQPPTKFINIPRIPWDHSVPLRSEVWKTPQPKQINIEVNKTQEEHKFIENLPLEKEPLPAAPLTQESDQTVIDCKQHSFLNDHKIEGNIVMPGAGFMAFNLLAHRKKISAFSKIKFDRFLPLGSTSSQTLLKKEIDGERKQWRSNGRTVFSCAEKTDAEPSLESLIIDISNGSDSGWASVNVIRFRHAISEQSGLDLNGAFKSLNKASINGIFSRGELVCPKDLNNPEALATILLDGAMQTLALQCGIDSVIFAPVSIEQIICINIENFPHRAKSLACIKRQSGSELSGDVELYAVNGTLLATLKGVTLRALPSSHTLSTSAYQLDWQSIGPNLMKKSVGETGNTTSIASAPLSLARLLEKITVALPHNKRIRILDGSKSGLIQAQLNRLSEQYSNLWHKQNILVASLAPVHKKALPFFHYVRREGIHKDDISSLLRPNSFDFIITSNEQAQQAEYLLAPQGSIVAIPSENSLPLPMIERSGIQKYPQKTLCLIGQQSHTLHTSLLKNFTITNRIEEADIIVDLRENLVTASALVKQVKNFPHAVSLIFLHRDAPLSDVINKNTINLPSPSPIPGFVRAARNEVRDIPIYSLGFSSSCNEQIIENALAEFISSEMISGCAYREYEWRYGDKNWYVPRLLPQENQIEITNEHDFRLDVAEPGQLQSLRWRPFNKGLEPLAPHEIRINVSHVSMHFKDVMLALGLLDNFDPIMGMECCGIITELGKDVPNQYPDLKIGAPVLCLSMTTSGGSRKNSLFGTSAIADARCTVLKPAGIAPEVAAGFLGVYSTAWYALSHVAKLQKGETVLIHSAAGGVGLSAVQIAKKLGANIIASAGNEEKRAFLQNEYGIQHVIDSHKPETFVKEVQARTNGKGVDVTLNSLAGEGLSQTLACLAPAGRHVEIGKRDILENNSMRLLVFKNNLTFNSVHLDILDKSHPSRVRSLIEECVERLKTGEAQPITSTVYPAERLIDAFRHLTSGRHRGKIIVNLENLVNKLFDNNAVKNKNSHVPLYPVLDALFSENETQLITGGLGGFGIELTRLLLENDARKLLLASRSAPNRKTRLALEGLRDAYPEAVIETISLDITHHDVVARLFESRPDITGIFHAATNYDAQVSTDIQENALSTWEVKVKAAENLHLCSQNHHIRHFVMFTSLAGLHGNTGQAVYVAANAALHDLARQRHLCGMSAMAIDLPVMLGAGRLSDPRYVAELQHNTSKGFNAVSYRSLKPVLTRLWSNPRNTPPVINLDHPEWASYIALNRNIALFEHLVPRTKHTFTTKRPPAFKPARKTRTSFMQQHTQSHDTSSTQVLEKIAFVLGATPDDIDVTMPLTDLGVDSLAATELAVWIEKSFGLEVSQTEFLSGITASVLMEKIGGQNAGEQQATPQPMAAPQTMTIQPMPEVINSIPPSPTQFFEPDQQTQTAPQINGATNAMIANMGNGQDASSTQVLEKIAFVLGATPDDIDVTMPLTDLGVDSLAATELAVWIEKSFGLEVSQTEFLSGITAAALMEKVDGQNNGMQQAASQPPATPQMPKVMNSIPPSPTQFFEPDQQTQTAPQINGSAKTMAASMNTGQDASSAQVLEKIAFVLGATPDDIDVTMPLTDLGVDSLAATELAVWIEKSFGLEVSQTEFLSGITVAALMEKVGGQNNGMQQTAPQPLQSFETPVSVVKANRIAETLNGTNDFNDQKSAINSMVENHNPSPVLLSSSGFIEVPLITKPKPQSGHLVISVPETLNSKNLKPLVAQIEAANQVIVLRRSAGAEHFCIGMDLTTSDFGDHEMSDGLDLFQKLADLIKNHELPVLCVIEGACRGGGMMFPAVSSIVVASESASFGLPEIRRGGLPGLVSHYLQNRVEEGVLRPALLTGDMFCSKFSQDKGLVDIIKPEQAIEQEVQRLLGRFKTIDTELLSQAKQFCPATSAEKALIAMGGLDPHERTRERDKKPLVNLKHQGESGVVIIELNDPEFNNAIDWAIADDLSKATEAIERLSPVKAIVLQGKGDHFCVGVNPYSFIRRTKSLPVTTAARVTYDIYNAFVRLREVGVPVICALQGKVMGGGLAASLNADYRIAAKETSFNYGNLSRGVCPGLLLSENLTRCVGSKWATELYMNDYTLNADQAMSIGLVNEVANNTNDAQKAALEMAQRLAQYPQRGVEATLDLMRPKVDRDRLAKESIQIARCNIKGGAFAPGWKAPERQIKNTQSTFLSMNSGISSMILEEDKKKTISPTVNYQLEATNSNNPNANWDWESDVFTGLETKDGSLTLSGMQPTFNQKGDASVFLTGATGFLGAYILRDLLNHKATIVSCLVRAPDIDSGFKRVTQNLKKYGLWQPDMASRLHVILGDISQEKLGLSQEVHDHIAQKCNVIIHNAACVDFTVPLDRLRPINVDAVREIVQLAAAINPAQLIHVSSLSVFSLHQFEGDSFDLRPNPQRLINGYSQSKWLGEQIVLLAGQQGLNVSVVRPGRIMGESIGGASNADDWFTRFLQSSIALGKIWNIDHETDMTPVDGVSKLIVDRLGEPAQNRTWHAISPQVLTTSEISQILQQRGINLESVSFDNWLSSAREAAKARGFEKEGLAPLIETFETMPNIGEKPTILNFSCDIAKSHQPNGEALLNSMLDWLGSKRILPVQSKNNSTNKGRSDDQPEADKTSNDPSSTVIELKYFKEEKSTTSTRNVGIHAMEIYFPFNAVRQTELEEFNKCPGKYTAGLGQESISFCGEDEDAVSMALTAVHRLMEKTGIGFDKIGRLDVGTESLVDRSKSIKTHLMSLFGEYGNYDIEGVDSYNACYGGTAAFLNAVSWCQSEAWDGRYALVVASDIAGLDTSQVFLNGAAAIAMLVGPDAPVIVEPVRASHMMNTWDFYKPVGWKDPFPVMPDGKHSIDMYLTCLRGCYEKLSEKRGGENLLKKHDYAVFHCASTYLCKRGFDEFVKSSGEPVGLTQRQALYKEMTEPSVKLTKQIGSSYTASCYVNLYSLFYHKKKQLQKIDGQENENRIIVFSYGSGSAATMYTLRVVDVPQIDSNIIADLEQRNFCKPQDFINLSSNYAKTYGKFDFNPSHEQERRKGVYYLENVDSLGVRHYKRALSVTLPNAIDYSITESA